MFGFDWNLDYKGKKEGKHVGLLEKYPRRQGESQQQTRDVKCGNGTLATLEVDDGSYHRFILSLPPGNPLTPKI